MNAQQTRMEQNRQFRLLLAHSTPEERRRLIKARMDRTLREEVERLGGPNGRGK